MRPVGLIFDLLINLNGVGIVFALFYNITESVRVVGVLKGFAVFLLTPRI